MAPLTWLPTVVCLILWRGPSTIARFIVAGIVLPFQRMSLRPLAHVFKERNEAILAQPTAGDRNAAPTVACVVPTGTDRATHDHSVPAHPSGRTVISVAHRVAVSARAFCRKYGGRLQNKQWVAVFEPAVVVKPTKAASIFHTFTGFNRAGSIGRIFTHREPLLSGVTGRAVSAAPSPHFTKTPLRLFALWLFLFGLFLILTAPASADHQVFLPYAGETWLAKQIRANQEYTFCLDARAASYPSFATQLADVNSEYAKRTGINSRQVSYSDPSCQVKHEMLPEFPCGAGAAACIYYANSPVVIAYQETLGYTDWRSAQGHELGHGILGQLHERYRDSGGSIGCGGTDEVGLTVMQCGAPFVRYPQSLDVQRGCSIIKTSWCGFQPAPACISPIEGVDECNPDLYRFASGWAYRFSDQHWINPHGWPEWQPCNVFGERWNYHFSVVMKPGSSFYSRGFWSSAGTC